MTKNTAIGDGRVVAHRIDADDFEPELAATACGSVICFSARSPDKPAGNEDALAVLQAPGPALVVVVADGMGGQSAGDEAARLTIGAISDAISTIDADDASRLRPAILDGIEAANHAVLQLGVGAGATLAVAEIADGHCRPYHVGDAAIVLMGQRGKLKHVSVAHSPVGYAEAAGMLNADEALRHEDRHFVSNHVGSAEMRIEVGPSLRLGRFDTLLLATDGLTDNLSTHEIVDTVRAGKLEVAAMRLVGAARKQMLEPNLGSPSKLDDLTFVAFRPSAR